MTTDSTFVQNKIIEETAHDIGVAVGKCAERACTTVKAFGEGVKKGIDDAKPIKEKVEEAGESLVKVVAEGVDNLAKDIEAEKDKIVNN